MERSERIASIITKADAARIARNLFYLSKDPLPYRKVNYTRPGQSVSTLDETDAFLAKLLKEYGYTVERESVQVQPFRCDTSKHPSHWYSEPISNDPWYTAYNLYAKLPAVSPTRRTVVAISHKDSPSWIDCPGATDNAAGTSCNLEAARLLAGQPLHINVNFIFCNEEHWPWTSVTAATNAAARGDDIIAVFNLDGCGHKSPEEKAAGVHLASTIHGTPEGERLADLLAEINTTYNLSVALTKVFREQPRNDDGSYIKAGFPAAIGVHGSARFEDPFYHRPEDVPERMDPESIRRTAQLVTAGIMMLNR